MSINVIVNIAQRQWACNGPRIALDQYEGRIS
jgi:hypothetical protein